MAVKSEPKEKMKAPPALILAFGKSKPKGGGKLPPDGDDETDDAYESGELPADFEDYAVQAFPDLEGDAPRIEALWKAMRACVKGM